MMTELAVEKVVVPTSLPVGLWICGLASYFRILLVQLSGCVV